jgi:hypothetical protein
MELLQPITVSYGLEEQQEEVRAARAKENDLVWQWAEHERMKRAGFEVGEITYACFRDPEQRKKDEEFLKNEKLRDKGEL